MKRTFGFLGIFVVILFIAASVYTVKCTDGVRESFVRLHIRANSDSEEDQQIKLYVRDKVILETEYLFKTCKTAQEAMKITEENQTIFAAAANRALAEKNTNYQAQAVYGLSFFPIRNYGGITLPAGEYHSLIINLGSGSGQNWWCVMFPPLCYTGESAELSEEAIQILKENLSKDDYDNLISQPEITVKWKLIEVIQEWINKIKK